MSSQPTRLRVHQRMAGYRKCESQKVGFATYEAALTAAEMMMLSGRVNRGCHMTPYQCQRCDEWHVCNRRINFNEGTNG